MSERRSILIVDDDDILRETIAYGFKRHDYKVFVACNGQEALQIFKEEEIEVILSDVQMPNGNGFDLLKAVREILSKQTVFILMTGYTNLPVQAALDAGADKVIDKPFDQKQLIQDIEIVSNLVRL